MSNILDYLWLILAIILVIVELFSGTIYLLMVALSAFITWLVQLLGLGFLGQGLVFTICSVAAVMFTYHYRKSKKKEPHLNIDAGETVVVEKWVNGVGLTNYRGVQWKVTLEEGANKEIAQADLYVIVGFDGNRLRVKAKQ